MRLTAPFGTFLSGTLLLVGSLQLGCDTACNLREEPALFVTVVGGGTPADGGAGAGGVGGANAAHLCDATVTAVDGAFREDLQCFARDTDCVCGSSDRPGTYTVTATLGDESETQIVTVPKTKCGVETQELCFFGPCDEDAP